MTLDTNYGMQIRKIDDLSHVSGSANDAAVPLAGQREAFSGVDVLPRSNGAKASFYSWSGSGQVILWDLAGRIKSSFQVPLEQPFYDSDITPANQLTIVRATKKLSVLTGSWDEILEVCVRLRR